MQRVPPALLASYRALYVILRGDAAEAEEEINRCAGLLPRVFYFDCYKKSCDRPKLYRMIRYGGGTTVFQSAMLNVLERESVCVLVGLPSALQPHPWCIIITCRDMCEIGTSMIDSTHYFNEFR